MFKFPKTVQNIMLISAISIAGLSADDGTEFNIVPSTPLDADFFSNDIPASYLAGNDDKTAINYAIIESGPTDELKDDEIYIEHIPVSNTDENKLLAMADTQKNHSAAGVFINENADIPENLVSIESMPTKTNTNISKTAIHPCPAESDNLNPGEFVTDETGGITAEHNSKDKYSAFRNGAFTFGYQFMYMNYSEHNTSSNIIYNGIKGEYTHTFDNNVVINASSSLLGGVMLENSYGSFYTDNKLTIGSKFSSSDHVYSLTPYIGAGLRYQNNVFSTDNVNERNNLQLYIPVGMRLDYTPSENIKLFSNIEVAPLALNQNWTSYQTGSNNSSAAFNGVSAYIEIGTQVKLSESITMEIKPFYQYIYTSKYSDSPVGSTDTHMAGINALFRF